MNDISLTIGMTMTSLWFGSLSIFILDYFVIFGIRARVFPNDDDWKSGGRQHIVDDNQSVDTLWAAMDSLKKCMDTKLDGFIHELWKALNQANTTRGNPTKI